VTAELLAEIWQRPADRELLAVYADWLAANGQAARAEYMQLSLLARRTPAQDRRRTALRAKHRSSWLGAARRFVYTYEDSDETPGFVAHVQCAMAPLTRGFELIRALGPRLVVNATQPKARREVIALAKLPLGTLWGLELYENDAQWLTDDVLAILGPALSGLRSLYLGTGEARASDRGWAAMLPHLDALEHLVLHLGDNPERWIELLLDSALTRTLTSLSVPGWIARAQRTRLERAFPSVVFRRGGRLRFNRETGFYES
jgi:uncharacterized protein (TIGR02996 family)